MRSKLMRDEEDPLVNFLKVKSGSEVIILCRKQHLDCLISNSKVKYES